jgi:hypothetical protein
MTTAIYHWWSHPGEPPAYSNLRTPILMSIATLRAVSDMPILVLDISENRSIQKTQDDWLHFPEKLNFRVARVNPALESYKHLVSGWPYLSRLYDLRDIDQCFREEDALMYVDTDVFWLQNPLPLHRSPERFCFDGWNSGFFYYDPKSATVAKFFEVFDAYTKASIYSHDVRKVMKQYLNYDGWYGVWDEMVLTYMAKHHPELFNFIPVEEHSTARVLQYADKSKVKMFHCNGTMVSNPLTGAKHSRGLMTLLASEFYQNLLKVMDEADIKMVFGQNELDYCLPRQFSLLENTAAFLATKDEEGHYHAQNVLVTR